MSDSNTLKTASVLAFERKLDPSDALFSSGNWNDRNNATSWQPIPVREKSVRGTISNRLKAKEQDPGKVDAAIENPNLQTVDVATLPPDADTLRVRFTLRVLGGTGTPSACNNNDYRAKLLQTVEGYVSQHGFSELAKRYATNIANGRFLWRNRLCGEEITVKVAQVSNGETVKEWQFDALNQAWNSFDVEANSDILSLAAEIESGLQTTGFRLFDIIADVRMGASQEVFPSQELILDKGGAGKKSKTLYTVSQVAAMHSQKIGNALRTIDTWYPDCQDTGIGVGPISVEPYGSVTSLGKAFRQPKEKKDFYNLLDRWVLKDQPPEEGDQHFVIANLVRGGVFGESEKA